MLVCVCVCGRYTYPYPYGVAWPSRCFCSLLDEGGATLWDLHLFCRVGAVESIERDREARCLMLKASIDTRLAKPILARESTTYVRPNRISLRR